MADFFYDVGKLLIHPNPKDPVRVSSLQIQNLANERERTTNPSSLKSSEMQFLMKLHVTGVDPPCITIQPVWKKQLCLRVHSPAASFVQCHKMFAFLK